MNPPTPIRRVGLYSIAVPMLAFAIAAGAQVAALADAPIDPQPQPPARYVQIAPGWLIAHMFTSERLGAGEIDVIDVLVGPEQRTDKLRIHAGGLFEVHAGRAVIEVNGKKRTITQGQIETIAAGDLIAIDNRKQQRALVARLIRFGDIDGELP